MDEMQLEIIKLALTVIALLFTGIQIYLLVAEIRSNKKWCAQDAAFNYCIQYSSLIGKNDKNGIDSFLEKLVFSSTEEVNEFFNKNSRKGRKNRKKMNILLQYFERLSIGILCDYFDEEVVRRTMNLTFINMYTKVEPYILMRRYETNHLICTHFERVAKSWKEMPIKYPYRSVPSKRKKFKKNK